MTTAQQTFSRGHAMAPALKCCPSCGKHKVDIRKRSTFGIGYDGHLLCSRCWQKDITLAASQA